MERGGAGNRFPALQPKPAAYVSSTMSTTPAILAGVLGLGAPELVIILVIMLVLFGGAKLPGLAKGLGQSIKEFKKASKDEPEAPAAPQPAATEVKKTEVPPVRHGTN
jgi:sec-independent protein translocase protein TatA